MAACVSRGDFRAQVRERGAKTYWTSSAKGSSQGPQSSARAWKPRAMRKGARDETHKLRAGGGGGGDVRRSGTKSCARPLRDDEGQSRVVSLSRTAKVRVSGEENPQGDPRTVISQQPSSLRNGPDFEIPLDHEYPTASSTDSITARGASISQILSSSWKDMLRNWVGIDEGGRWTRLR